MCWTSGLLGQQELFSIWVSSWAYFTAEAILWSLCRDTGCQISTPIHHLNQLTSEDHFYSHVIPLIKVKTAIILAFLFPCGTALPLVYIRVPRDDQISADVLTFVSFTCLSSGDPTPTVHWEKNGELVENSERIDINPDTYAPIASILSILAAQATDTGDYRCIASNPAGEDSELFQLKVSGMLAQNHAHRSRVTG